MWCLSSAGQTRIAEKHHIRDRRLDFRFVDAASVCVAGPVAALYCEWKVRAGMTAQPTFGLGGRAQKLRQALLQLAQLRHALNLRSS